jgi:hypothetical protein
VRTGGGLLTIQSTGAVTSTHYEDRQPTIVTLQGPPGRNVPKMEIGLRTLNTSGDYTPTVVTGVWDAKANCTVFKWNASATKLAGSSSSVVPDTGTKQYDYLFRLLNTNGSAYLNELGEPITMDGVMTLGGGASAPVSLQQSVTQLAQTAQVQNRLTHNAFGEVSEEYDDEVYDRAVEMAKLYDGSADAAAVRTTFASTRWANC